MPLHSALSYIDRDTRRRERITAGSTIARYVRPADISYVGAACAVYPACVKPKGLSIPEGVVVVAVRRDAHSRCFPVLIEAFEGDAAAFASFPRLAHMLGATELHLITKPATMLERIRAVEDLKDKAAADRAAILARPLATGGKFDRSAIMATACAAAKVRQSVTGEPWATCLSAALRGVWQLARAARLATVH